MDGGKSVQQQVGDVMGCQVLDGKALAAEFRAKIAKDVEALKQSRGIVPGLGVVLVGLNPASVSYVTAKEKACAEAGMLSREVRMPESATTDEVLAVVRQLNDDPEIHGILVQLPLPKQVDEKSVINAIVPEKDVDGFTPVNVGRMMLDEPCFLPCTPHGIIKMLEAAGVETSGKHAVVIGRSNIVGKPVASLLARKGKGANATVTLCHTGTKDLASFTRQADIIVVAAGRPQTLTGDMVKPGAAVIDVGVNRVADETRANGFRLEGDADFESVKQVASVLTPVPGGVGPMTITMLLQNTLEAALRQKD